MEIKNSMEKINVIEIKATEVINIIKTDSLKWLLMHLINGLLLTVSYSMATHPGTWTYKYMFLVSLSWFDQEIMQSQTLNGYISDFFFLNNQNKIVDCSWKFFPGYAQFDWIQCYRTQAPYISSTLRMNSQTFKGKISGLLPWPRFVPC